MFFLLAAMDSHLRRLHGSHGRDELTTFPSDGRSAVPVGCVCCGFATKAVCCIGDTRASLGRQHMGVRLEEAAPDVGRGVHEIDLWGGHICSVLGCGLRSGNSQLADAREELVPKVAVGEGEQRGPLVGKVKARPPLSASQCDDLKRGLPRLPRRLTLAPLQVAASASAAGR